MLLKIKPWQFLLVSTLILAGILAFHAASQARQDELRVLEQECEQQLQQLREMREQLDEAADRLEDLENMLLNLRYMERIVTGSAISSRGGRITLTTMPLTTPSGFSAARFERAFEDTPLAGIGTALIQAETEYGINALVLAGICALESGWGTSRLARERNNLAGLGAYGPELGMTFDTRADCIDYLARLLAGRPGTLADVGRWYAADPARAAKVAGCMRVIMQRAEVEA